MKLIKKKYKVNSKKIPKAFDEFKIVQISDLHSLRKYDEIMDLIDEPDIIVITGDLIDGRSVGFHCIGFLKQLSEIAPVYYITGNHEATYLDQFKFIERHVRDYVTVLHDEKIVLKRDDAEINLIGLDDLKYYEVLEGRDRCLPDDRLKDFDMSNYSIVLLHSPNNFNYISQYKPDLILSGHTHGGQFRLPIIGALYAPGQGLFPKLDRGVFTKGVSTLIVSAGIGYSRINKRILCPSEVCEIVLKST